MPLVVRRQQDHGATSFLGRVHQRHELVQSILGQLQEQQAYHGQQVQQLPIQLSTNVMSQVTLRGLETDQVHLCYTLKADHRMKK
jgi:hypothetical protein